MAGLGYSHADLVASWEADRYFDLDRDQKHAFDAKFEQLYAWHRYEQLPEYVAFLREAKQRLQRGYAGADLEWFAEGLKTRYRVLVKRAAPDAADLLATLSAQQIDALQRRWDRDNRKFVRERHLDDTAGARKRARAKRMMSQIETWTGNLTGAQETRIAALIDEIPDTARLRYEDRLRRQHEFVELLGLRKGDRRAFAERLESWLVDWRSGRNPEYARLSDIAWDRQVRFYVALQAILTPEQRSAALHRLQTNIDEFRRLARRG